MFVVCLLLIFVYHVWIDFVAFRKGLHLDKMSFEIWIYFMTEVLKCVFVYHRVWSSGVDLVQLTRHVSQLLLLITIVWCCSPLSSRFTVLHMFMCMLGYFSVSVIHQTWTWTTRALMCICSLSAYKLQCVYTTGTSFNSLIERTFVESAQTLMPEKSQSWHRASHPTVACPPYSLLSTPHFLSTLQSSVHPTFPVHPTVPCPPYSPLSTLQSSVHLTVPCPPYSPLSTLQSPVHPTFPVHPTVPCPPHIPCPPYSPLSTLQSLSTQQSPVHPTFPVHLTVPCPPYSPLSRWWPPLSLLNLARAPCHCLSIQLLTDMTGLNVCFADCVLQVGLQATTRWHRRKATMWRWLAPRSGRRTSWGASSGTRMTYFRWARRSCLPH